MFDDVFMLRLDGALLNERPVRRPQGFDPLAQARKRALAVVDEAELVGLVEE